MKLAIIDLDGVIANVDARFDAAKNTAQAAFAGRDLVKKQEYDDVYWSAVFDPAQVHLDTLIDGVKEATDTLRLDGGFKIVYLTSRPEAMRGETAIWLLTNCVMDDQTPLVLKPKAFQYVKTVVWKAGMCQHLAAFYGADEMLVVDDEAQNRDHLAAVLIEAQASFKSVVLESLAQAVAYARDGTLPEIKPF